MMNHTIRGGTVIAALALSPVVHAGSPFTGTSFEEPPLFGGVQYVDLGDPSTDHQLFNNPDEPFVEYTSVGGELGFSAFYFNTRNSVGLTDGDFVGVTDFTGDVGAYTDGLNGYQMQDTDGKMQFVLDTVVVPPGPMPTVVSIDYFLNETGWESDDSFRIYIEVDGGVQIDIFNSAGSDIDDLGVEDFWINGSADLSGFTTATVIAELDSNSSSETIYLDNIQFTQVPAPGALALLGLAGLATRRRRR